MIKSKSKAISGLTERDEAEGSTRISNGKHIYVSSRIASKRQKTCYLRIIGYICIHSKLEPKLEEVASRSYFKLLMWKQATLWR